MRIGQRGDIFGRIRILSEREFDDLGDIDRNLGSIK